MKPTAVPVDNQGGSTFTQLASSFAAIVVALLLPSLVRASDPTLVQKPRDLSLISTEPPRPPKPENPGPSPAEHIRSLAARSEAVWLCDCDISDGTNIHYKAKQPIMTNATSPQITNGQILQSFPIPGPGTRLSGRWPTEVFVFLPRATSTPPASIAVRDGKAYDTVGITSRVEVIKLIQQMQRK